MRVCVACVSCYRTTTTTTNMTDKQTFCALCLKADVGELDDKCHCAVCAKALVDLEKLLAEQKCVDCNKANESCECLTTECQYCCTEYRIIDGYGEYCSKYCLTAMSGVSCYCCYDD